MPAAGIVAERVDRGTVLNLHGVNCVCLLVRWLNGGRRGEKDWSSTPNFPSFWKSGLLLPLNYFCFSLWRKSSVNNSSLWTISSSDLIFPPPLQCLVLWLLLQGDLWDCAHPSAVWYHSSLRHWCKMTKCILLMVFLLSGYSLSLPEIRDKNIYLFTSALL